MGKNSKNIRYLMCRELERQIQIGTKKRADKSANYHETGERKARYIHAEKTVGDDEAEKRYDLLSS